MTGVGHLITGGSLATAVLPGVGVRDSRQFLPVLAVALLFVAVCIVVVQIPSPLFLLALFVFGGLFLKIN